MFNLDINQFECSICLSNIEDDNNIITKTCKHIFHKKCFEKHIKTTKRNIYECPKCINPLNKNSDIRKINKILNTNNTTHM